MMNGIKIITNPNLLDWSRTISWRRTGGKTIQVTISEGSQPSKRVIRLNGGTLVMHPAMYAEMKASLA